MNTATIQVYGTSFTIEGCVEGKYALKIERSYPWETVTAYGTLRQDNGNWILDNMTIEDAHQEVMLQDFFRELLKTRVYAYPKAIEYWEQNNLLQRQIDALANHFKPAV